MMKPDFMTGAEFLGRFRAGLLAAWLLPLATSFLIVGYLGDVASTDLMRTLRHLVSVYTVGGIALGYALLNRHMTRTVDLASRESAAHTREAERRVARFPYLFAALFSAYALVSPVIVNLSLEYQTGAVVSPGAQLFAVIGVMPATAVILLLALYVFSDLVGQYFGPRGFRVHFFSLRMKVVALGVVMPLVVNTALILYVGHRTGDMGAGTLAIWAGLLAVSLPVAYFAQASFNKSFAPLRRLRSQALHVLDDLDTIIEPVPVSLDEFGDLTRDWATLTRRMTSYWRELKYSTEHYRTMINAIDEAIAIVDFDMKAVFLGPGFAQWLNDTPSTFVGRSLDDLVHHDDLVHFHALAAEAMARPTERPEGQVRLRHPDGTYHRVCCNWRHIKQISGEAALFVSLRDISQQLTAQERLQAGEIRLRTMMQSVADGILSMDEKGVIQSVNPAAAELFGYEGNKLVGCSISILLPTSMASTIRKLPFGQGDAAGLERLVGNGAHEMTGRRKDGSSFPMELSVTEMRIGPERNFVSVVRDVSEQKKSEADLRRALQDAEGASRIKSLFLANMSHELRTPLNAIIGFSEVMKEGMFGQLENERYVDYIGSIHDSSRHLLSVINDILDISRIEAGELELDEEWLEVRDVLNWAQDRAAPTGATAPHAPVFTHVSSGLPELKADRRSLRQIVINLLSNATKFTPLDGRIDLYARLDEFSGISIVVKDTGIGIPADQVDKMTLPFTQSDNSLARRYEGTGLGLAITRSLVEAHGGRLEIESVEGEGTTITVRMPAARVWNVAAERSASA